MKASDLSSLCPYQFNAHVVINRGTSAEKSGTVTIYRDKTDYRYEAQIEDYREEVVRKENKLYTWYSAFPDPGLYVIRSIDKWPNQLSAKNIAGRTSRRKVDKMEAYCVEFNSLDSSRLSGCFDPSTSLLLAMGDRALQTESFLDYQSIGEQQFPRTIRITRPDLGQMEIKDIHIQRVEPGVVKLEIPNGAHQFETCDDK